MNSEEDFLTKQNQSKPNQTKPTYTNFDNV